MAAKRKPKKAEAESPRAARVKHVEEAEQRGEFASALPGNPAGAPESNPREAFTEVPSEPARVPAADLSFEPEAVRIVTTLPTYSAKVEGIVYERSCSNCKKPVAPGKTCRFCGIRSVV